MSDTNYYEENTEYSIHSEDIENEVYYEINSLLNNENMLYRKDKFKCHANDIDIIYPQHFSSELKAEFNGPDSIRFLLSLYPLKENLSKVRSIILRPRHIESEGTELLSLYVRREKTLALYLHYPHLYHVNLSMISSYSNIEIINTAGLVEKYLKFYNNAGDKNITRIPPLWYFLNIITMSADDIIEKFFIKRDIKSSDIRYRKISDISFHYARMGY